MSTAAMPNWVLIALRAAGIDPDDVNEWAIDDVEVGQVEPVKLKVRMKAQAKAIKIDFTVDR